MEEINYSDFNLPSDFQTTSKFKRAGDGIEGVQTMDYGAGYVPWRFVNAARPWKEDKVKRYRTEGADTVPVLMFYRDRDNQIPIKLRRKVRYEDRRDKFGDLFDKRIPLTLKELKEENPEATEMDLWELPDGYDTEMFQVAFEKWKEAGIQKGTPLSAWRATPGQTQTLSSLGIHYVEQFGRMDERSVKELVKKLPPSLHGDLNNLHEMAVIFVESQSGVHDIKALGDKLQVIEDSNEKLQEALEEKDEEIQSLLAKIKGQEPKKKGPGRPKKEAADD